MHSSPFKQKSASFHCQANSIPIFHHYELPFNEQTAKCWLIFLSVTFHPAGPLPWLSPLSQWAMEGRHCELQVDTVQFAGMASVAFRQAC